MAAEVLHLRGGKYQNVFDRTCRSVPSRAVQGRETWGRSHRGCVHRIVLADGHRGWHRELPSTPSRDVEDSGIEDPQDSAEKQCVRPHRAWGSATSDSVTAAQ